MLERALHVDHTTIYRWVQRYAPERDKRCRSHLKATTDSWRVDETYVKVKGTWMSLYRAVDGFARKHLGISAQCHTRCRSGQTLLLEHAHCTSSDHSSGHHGR